MYLDIEQKGKAAVSGKEGATLLPVILLLMARSRYFVFNGRQPKYFIKREGSVFLETWHGTPLKKLVFDL